MNIKEITEYLVDFQHREFPSLIKRDLEIKETKKIISIIGPRRAGKTYFIYQSMEEMLKDMKRENLIYLNFEDTRLLGITFKDIKEIIKLQWKLYPNSMKKLVVFIDEPQNIKNWEHAVRSLYDEGFKIFLTGSSSKLLSKEIASSLRGRTLSYLLMPFSFREVLKLKKFECSFNKLSSKERSLLDYYLDNYIKLGGFPEILIEEDKQTQIKILKEYLDLIVYRDVVERYNLKNTKLIQWLIKCLIASFSKEFSVHKTYLTLKSQGIKVSKNTLYTYVSLLEDSLFAFFIPSFSQSQRKKGFSINKVYINDIGFVNLLEVSTDRGKRMENIVFLELQRRKSPLTSIFYWKNVQKEEVDFVIKEGQKLKQLIQVCYDISDLNTKKREFRALLKASKELKCNNLLIITEDKEGEERIEKKKIKFIPLWKWLLIDSFKNKK